MMALPINSLYSLTWGDYGTSLVSAIQLLRCHGDLVDCTLAAGGRSFPAHKIVLCAASPFLLELLKNTPCKHPVVMLAGVNANDLEALLEFVYRGEVSVDHSQLPSLLQAAHCLNIQGLAPQTVAKDDYTTQIQLHPMIPQHHVKAVIDDQEQLIATIAAPQPTATVHTQVVEDINPGTITAVQEVKDVINQFLPARKRKTRAVKKPGDANKIARTETVMTTTATENGETATISTPSGKSGSANTETVITVTDTTGTPASANSSTVSQTSKTTTNALKPRSRSQSEQPATCPICFAVIRQSRNLRRHLELRHFAKPGTKKERKVGTQKKSASGTSTASTNTTTVSTSTIPTVQSVQTLHTLQTVQVKKDPDAMNSSAVTPVTLTVGPGLQQQHQLQHQQHNQQQQTTAIIDQSGNITTNQGQQQIVTQTENTDGTTSLSIAHVQTLPTGHQLTLGNINQANTFYTQ